MMQRLRKCGSLHIHYQSLLHLQTLSLMKNSRLDLMQFYLVVLQLVMLQNKWKEDEPIATPQVDTTPVQSSSEQEDDDTMDYFRSWQLVKLETIGEPRVSEWITLTQDSLFFITLLRKLNYWIWVSYHLIIYLLSGVSTFCELSDFASIIALLHP